jgi:hypothetical protein
MLSSRVLITRLQDWRPFLYGRRSLLLVGRSRIKPLAILPSNARAPKMPRCSVIQESDFGSP